MLAVADYLLGTSCARANVATVSDSELLFHADILFGGLQHARTGLRMIRAFYYRDYKLLRDIYLEGHIPSEAKKITSALNSHEERGSFPTSHSLPCVHTHSFFLPVILTLWHLSYYSLCSICSYYVLTYCTCP